MNSSETVKTTLGYTVNPDEPMGEELWQVIADAIGLFSRGMLPDSCAHRADGVSAISTLIKICHRKDGVQIAHAIATNWNNLCTNQREASLMEQTFYDCFESSRKPTLA